MSERIDIRVSTPMRKKIEKKASINRETISEYARRVFTKSLEEDDATTDPLINKEMLSLILWMHIKKYGYYDQHSIEETKYYFSILKKYIFDLDSEYQLLFFKVYNDLERVINDYIAYHGIFYYFSSNFKTERFDFEKFEELIFKRKLI